MKTFFILFAVFIGSFIAGQNIDFNHINSQNIFDILNNSELSKSQNSSKSEVIQLGNNNDAHIYDKSKKSDLLIRQTGDYNTTLMTNTNSNLENKQKVNIEGTNNYIDITGNNSNSKEMQINLKTNDKMIFVRHY